MTTIFVDPAPEQGDVRHFIYEGDAVVYTRVRAVTELVEFARAQLCKIFAPYDPEDAHLHFSPEEAAAILAEWKPRFMREERTRCLQRAIIEEVGFSLKDTNIDFTKPRTAFPVGHLTTGIAYAFPWHRDTWYASPPQQINWWLPIYEVSKTNAMKFDFGRFAAPVANTSAGFDYYTINEDRQRTAMQTRVEIQSRPSAIDHHPVDCTIILPPIGSVLLFSGTQLHATIPNESGRSRYSLDFRTVYRGDVEQNVGAPIVDAECTGTSLRDFVNVVSGEQIDEELVRSLYGDPPPGAVLVFPR